MKQLLTGNEAAALGAKMARPQVVAAYPITPQTSIAEKLAEYAATGALAARYMTVESETAAMAACIGGSLAGTRVFTATSSQGLALMHELLHWSSGARLPIVLVNVNRSMAAPWSLGVDQNDSLSQRDTGWMQFYCETGQEMFDSILIAYRLAEEMLLPVMVVMDGFYCSHYMTPVDVPSQEDVDRFLPRRKSRFRLEPACPGTFGGGVSSAVLFDLRKRMQADMEKAGKAFARHCTRFFRIFGRRYGAVETFGPRGSDITLVTSGALTGSAKSLLSSNTTGLRVRLVKVRMFRPFPKREIVEALRGQERVVVIDRNLSPGSGGIFGQEIRSALSEEGSCGRVTSVIGGLGGVDVTPDDIGRLVEDVARGNAPRGEMFWMV